MAEVQAPTLTLAEFLLARIAEDEAVASEAVGHGVPRWRVGVPELDDGDPTFTRSVWQDQPGYVSEDFLDWQDPRIILRDDCSSDAQSVHIARHDPARVLAECEAKRQIVQMAVGAADAQEKVRALADANPESQEAIDGLTLTGGMRLSADAACAALALPYADHPDYRQEWAL